MSSSTWIVIFFLLNVGPAILTILRRKLLPDASRKNVMKSTTIACPARPTRPSVLPHR